VSARCYLRTLNPQLPRDVWLLQAGGVANSVGNGLTLPFLAIYLHGVSGFSLAEVVRGFKMRVRRVSAQRLPCPHW
jgi:hypothetical protein